MIRSMTGYGKSDAVVNSTPTTIEVRCVNGRYLELNCRMPKEWADKEGAVRETAREQVSRGSLSIFIRQEDLSSTQSVRVNPTIARGYVEALRSLKQELSLDGEITMDHLVQFSSIFQAPDAEGERPDPWPELHRALVDALRNLNTMRDLEGAELYKDFAARLEGIETGLVDVEARSIARIPVERERLRERVRQLMAEEAVDEQRLQLEIVLLAEKLDVSEECVRLRSHIKFFRENLQDGKGVGRKLNFLLQEMNREVNTIGSKTNDAAIAVVVVQMKEELERMREQVQNVE